MLQQREDVESWGETSIPAEHHRQVRRQIRELKALAHGPGGDGDWRLIGNKAGFRYYAPGKTAKSLRCWAEGSFPCSAQVAVDLIGDDAIAMKLDKNIASLSVLETLSDFSRVAHIQMKPLYFTAARDVVIFENRHTDPETGTIYKVNFSVDHAAAPEAGKTVRAFATGVTSLEPDPLNAHSVKIRILVDIDVRMDQVPSWVLKAFGGAAQSQNAQAFADNLATLKKMAEARQRACPAQHVVLNEGGRFKAQRGGGLAAEAPRRRAADSRASKSVSAMLVLPFPVQDLFISVAIAIAYVVAVISNSA